MADVPTTSCSTENFEDDVMYSNHAVLKGYQAFSHQPMLLQPSLTIVGCLWLRILWRRVQPWTQNFNSSCDKLIWANIQSEFFDAWRMTRNLSHHLYLAWNCRGNYTPLTIIRAQRILSHVRFEVREFYMLLASLTLGPWRLRLHASPKHRQAWRHIVWDSIVQLSLTSIYLVK